MAADPQPYSEFKLMFVNMKLLVDQRKIPELLVNCANSKLPIDVLRIRMDEPVGAAGSGSAPPVAGAMESSKPAAGATLSGGMNLGAARSTANSSSSSTNDDAVVTHPYDVPVEICGVVQIYNQPDKEKLAGGSSADPNKRPATVPTLKVVRPRSKGGLGGGMGGSR